MKPVFQILVAALLALPASSGAQTAPESTPGTGTLYVFRADEDNGPSYALTYQNKTLARMKSGTYVVLQLPEGRQYMLVDPTAKDVYGVDIKTGADQYAQIVTEGNLLRRTPTLVDATRSEFDSIRSSMKQVQLRNEP